jgi:hypothetical protein
MDASDRRSSSSRSSASALGRDRLAKVLEGEYGNPPEGGPTGRVPTPRGVHAKRTPKPTRMTKATKS